MRNKKENWFYIATHIADNNAALVTPPVMLVMLLVASASYCSDLTLSANVSYNSSLRSHRQQQRPLPPLAYTPR